MKNTPNNMNDLGYMLDAHEYVNNVTIDTQGEPGYHKFTMCDGTCEPMPCAVMIVDGRCVATCYDPNAGVEMCFCEGEGYASFKFWLDGFFG